ncbi:MAG: sigma-70 family RNA polymerase sigma factor [Pseudomonadota bacterium]|nr:RNA polymerase subunit sigma-70 [Gammaproteobacteria bacterium]MBJ56194.1 RNA polymerase subunit sigma-70 [Gammaproteobacteria bacterium]MEC8859177.1 sigma-70 family RNA polymerase sigma factor [Pseudomonadota bacterium]HBN15449.1 RNA polymerase subunit sigma-70 [Pseudohongiella sp.]|tara:strand:- start:1164 stop:1739 length:576 start_codon:yes stop_codon:yes gene_type:complete
MKQTIQDTSDEVLIAAALDGSLTAWNALVRRHERQVYNFSLRFTGNPDDARDLMQEVFLGLYRNLENFRGQSQLTTWLFRIGHNKAVDMARRRQAGPVVTALDDEVHAEVPQADDEAELPDRHLQEQQSNARIQRVLQQLPVEQRLVVELKIFQELTFDDIAEIESISANTAKTRFYAALKKLKSLLESTP